MKILMVCLGNICRSPLAEGILQNKIDKTSVWTGKLTQPEQVPGMLENCPDSRSVEVALKYGIDITNQRARQFRASDLQEFDFIFAMDSSNYQNIINKANSKEEEEKVQMIMNEVQPGFNQNVPDPYYDNDGFEIVFQMLDEACERVIEKFVD